MYQIMKIYAKEKQKLKGDTRVGQLTVTSLYLLNVFGYVHV